MCISQFGFAQPQKHSQLDSLLKVLTLAKEDTSKVMLLNNIAQKYPNYDPNKGFEYAEAGLKLAEKLQFDKGIAISGLSMGLNEISRTNYENAKKCLNLAIEKSREQGLKKTEGSGLKNMGIVYYNLSNNPEALKCFFEALTIEEDIHSTKEIYAVLEYIGIVYESQKNFEKALTYYTRSYDSALAAGETSAKVKNLINIGQIYLQLSKPNEGLLCFNQALKAAREINDETGIAVALATRGSAYFQLNRFNEALQNNLEALAMYEKYSDMYNISSVYNNLGRVYLGICKDTTGAEVPDSLRNVSRNLERAFFYFNKGMDICRSVSNLEGLYISYHDISEVWELKGDYKSALTNYKTFVQVRDSIFSADNNIKIANLETNRELELKDKQLKINQLEFAKKRTEKFYFIGGIVLLLAVTVILYRNFSVQKQLNAKITRLVNEQEQTIENRTRELTHTNKKLVDLIQFNVHNMREPITRIMGLLMLRQEVEQEEFYETIIPMMDKSVQDLDNTLKDVINSSELKDI